MNFKVGQCVRVGGKLGSIMTITSISGDDMVLKSDNCTFYFHKGDCSLFPVKAFEQLSLFDMKGGA